MPLEYISDKQTFFLHAGSASYAMKVMPKGHLAHLYWGAALRTQDLDHVLRFRDRAFSPNPDGRDRSYSLDTMPLEYPVHGGDFRSPALEILQQDGARALDLQYKRHEVLKGKPALAGLPATYAFDDEAETLIVELADAKLGLSVELLYTAFAKYPVITRSARITNGGSDQFVLQRALSCSVDFSGAFTGHHFLQLAGAWGRERDLHHTPLRPGLQSIESRRGASSHQHNPFFAITEHADSEDHGNVYGFNLVYSGNFLGLVERDSSFGCRAQIGLNSFDFSWRLPPGETFQTPEAVMVFSSQGLGEMSRTYHRLYRHHLTRGKWQHKPRPILVNNWEATYFDFNAEKLEAIAGAASRLGIELFVLDDGWFGKRDDDFSSLGDWFVDRNKLPDGLEDLAARINRMGLEFGLWFEPEMISPDSDLYRAHPEWCLHAPGRTHSLSRNQLILDFSRKEVRDEIYNRIAAILRSVPITYVKWDMNRHMTEVGSAALPAEAQQETAHRYMLGLYEFMERLITEFPEVLFEGCSGGGGRFDPGILHYMPQIWASDNSDAITRLRIQYGTSIAYPWSTIAAHVSVVPNHQVGRVTPFRTRGDVAFTGAFGYELDLSILSEADSEEVKRQTASYKKLRPLLVNGDLYRLLSPFDSNETAWMVISEAGDEALVTHVTTLAEPNPPQHFLRLKGLDPLAIYKVVDSEESYSGDALMHIGLPVPVRQGDFLSVQWLLRRQ